jgi:gas vesicle protein
MKSRSALFLLGGIVIGAIATYLMTPQKSIKTKKGPVKKLKKKRKDFEETALKYKEKLSVMKDGVGKQNING